jgi:beta-N-acetylhexosaminidase
MLEIYAARPDFAAATHAQWEKVFGAQWPMDRAWFEQVTRAATWLPGDHLLAQVDGRPVGFALTQVGAGAAPGGALLALGVLPEYRRRGVGRALHAAALQQVRARGARKVGLGSGALEYFWPGVPLDAPGAWAFFQAMGWQERERSFDLVRSLADYHTPAWVWERVNGLDVEYSRAAGSQGEAVLAFVAAEEIGWKGAYASYFERGRASDVLLARRRSDGQLVGACLLESDARRWAACFPGPLAAPGCFLVGERWQGQGIGMALVARAVELLQERGCQTCFIGWTWLVDWYGKLGFQVWQENIMSSRELLPDKKLDPYNADRQ